MRKNYFVVAVGFWVCFGLTAPSFGQKLWEKKPYREWSKKEALKILNDSPWAQVEDALKDDPSMDNPFAKLPSSSPLGVTVRLRSALPVRQAFVRQKQIGIKYEKLNPSDRAKFDAEVKEFLECPPCAKYYIVTVESAFLLSRIKTFPEQFSLDKLKERAYLANDRGQWRKCVHARQENQEILFFFQRTDEQGKTLVTNENKEFYFTMSGQVSDGKLGTGGYYTFEVSEASLNGEIMF